MVILIAMSYYIQLLVEIIVLTVFSASIIKFLDNFKLKRFYFMLFLLPLLSFIIGFSLRFTGDKFLIDIGFFFTDFSYLFVYLIFAVALILGQLRYWKIKQ